MSREQPSRWKRHRANVAQRTLRRVAGQVKVLTSRYAGAADRAERLAVVLDAFRAASAPGAHQADQAAADRIVDDVVTYLLGLTKQLHAAQSAAAEKTLANEERRTSNASTSAPVA